MSIHVVDSVIIDSPIPNLLGDDVPGKDGIALKTLVDLFLVDEEVGPSIVAIPLALASSHDAAS